MIDRINGYQHSKENYLIGNLEELPYFLTCRYENWKAFPLKSNIHTSGLLNKYYLRSRANKGHEGTKNILPKIEYRLSKPKEENN